MIPFMLPLICVLFSLCVVDSGKCDSLLSLLSITKLFLFVLFFICVVDSGKCDSLLSLLSITKLFLVVLFPSVWLIRVSVILFLVF